MSKKINRRDFVAASVGTAAGIGAFGLLGGFKAPLTAKHKPRGPAAASDDTYLEWSLISPWGDLFNAKRFNVVIVGSGYGGAVTASRLAGERGTVAILERGKEWLPGDFPENAMEFLHANRNPQNPMGLVDMHMPAQSDMDVVCAAGVGGTSLLNAAISTRPEKLVFEQAEWPEEIRAAYKSGELTQFYDRASDVLSPRIFSGTMVPKVELQQKAAHTDALRGDFSYLPLNVSYDQVSRGDRNHHLTQPACRLCGNCCSGCNYGSKNTLQANYLLNAKIAGAKVFAGIQVDRIERLAPGAGGGFRVHYASHEYTGKIERTSSIDADLVIVAAGSLGSTEILMRSQAKGLALSSALGTRVSANGDVLGFSYNGDKRTDSVGDPSGSRPGHVGTALMSYIDYRGEHAKGPNIQDRFLLIEGSTPSALAGDIAQALAEYAFMNPGYFSPEQMSRVKKDRQAVLHWQKQENDKKPGMFSGISDFFSSPKEYATEVMDTWLGYDPDGALNHSTLFLACGHDDSGGRYVYVPGGRPKIVWKGVAQQEFSKTINATMKAHAELQGGHFIANPRTTIFKGRIMATHPLGGCPMGQTVEKGVVDHLGRVFDPSGGVYANLYVIDGSVIPRSLGATPLLTISALAERTADSILQKDT